jgi:hypothetical protein
MRDYKRLRIFFWCAAIGLEAVDVWVSRNAMNPDGVCYLDMGDAFFHHNWHMAVNAYWSPLYPWIQGLFLRLLKPSAHWEYPAVHLVNFLIFIGALASFEFFLSAFVKLHRNLAEDPKSTVGLPDWAWYLLGYSLFIWASIVMIGVRTAVSPDLCVAASVYLASGFLLRMRRGAASWGAFALFGAVLGAGYLAKAVMFPLAFVFLAVAVFSVPSFHEAALRVLTSALVFAAIASAWAILVSRAKGRLTFGDTGRVNYECYVDGNPLWFPAGRALKHPIPRLVERPATYEFRTPVGGTYPLWYDPSYWHEGLVPHFSGRGESEVLVRTLRKYVRLVFSPRLELYVVVGLLALAWMGPGRSFYWRSVVSNWPVLIPAVAAIGGYALVHTDLRYVAAYVVIIWLALFSAVRVPVSYWSRRIATGVLLAVGAISFYRPIYIEAATRVPRYWQAAEELGENGVMPGSKIAIVGRETFGMRVARLARTQIIAQVREEASGFWNEPPAVRAGVIEALQKTGATAVLASASPPQSHLDAGWKKMGNTPYYLYLLAEHGPAEFRPGSPRTCRGEIPDVNAHGQASGESD